MITIEIKNRDGEVAEKLTASSIEEAYMIEEEMEDAYLEAGIWDYYNFYIDGKLLAY